MYPASPLSQFDAISSPKCEIMKKIKKLILAFLTLNDFHRIFGVHMQYDSTRAYMVDTFFSSYIKFNIYDFVHIFTEF